MSCIRVLDEFNVINFHCTRLHPENSIWIEYVGHSPNPALGLHASPLDAAWVKPKRRYAIPLHIRKEEQRFAGLSRWPLARIASHHVHGPRRKLLGHGLDAANQQNDRQGAQSWMWCFVHQHLSRED